MRSAPEQILQRQVAAYLSWALTPPAWFTSIPAGGGGEMRGRILKGTGYKAGCPDLMILFDGRAHFIELKSAKGVLSEAQKQIHDELRAAQCPVEVCRSLDDVRALMALDGPWWPLAACIRETKPSTERIRRGFKNWEMGCEWPESEPLGRRRRKAT